jgi:signal transduction histidine kinase
MARSTTSSQKTPSVGPLLTVLLLTLGVAGAITWIAWVSADSHRATAEDALRDYAEFAADNYTAAAQRAFGGSTVALLAPVGVGRPSMDADHVYSLDTLLDAARSVRKCRCMYDPSPRYFFRFSLADSTLTIAGDSLPDPTERTRLLDSLAANFDTLGRQLEQLANRRAMVYASVDTVHGQFELYMMTLTHGIRGTPNIVYGFVTSFRTFAERVLPTLIDEPLVPRSLTRGLPNDSLLAVTVRDDRGHLMYRSIAQYDTTYSATRSLWRWVPEGPRVQITVRPEAANTLLRGGIPRSRLPIIVALFICAGALVLIAVHLVRRAQELAQLRADFTSSVSHELRTPLAQILLFAESLQFGRVAGDLERSEALRIILREARRLAHLVDNVLLFSRTERRATRVSAQPRPLAPIINDVVQSFEPLARVRRATLRTQLDERVVATVDPGALRQVLVNLLDNAVKYGPEGQTVDVGLALEGTRARIWVDDEGNGIREIDCQRIWEPFVRLESGEYSVATGSGIGLSVVRQLVLLHGGDCRVGRSPSGGARFEVELPRATADATSPDALPHDLATLG